MSTTHTFCYLTKKLVTVIVGLFPLKEKAPTKKCLYFAYVGNAMDYISGSGNKNIFQCYYDFLASAEKQKSVSYSLLISKCPVLSPDFEIWSQFLFNVHCSSWIRSSTNVNNQLTTYPVRFTGRNLKHLLRKSPEFSTKMNLNFLHTQPCFAIFCTFSDQFGVYETSKNKFV